MFVIDDELHCELQDGEFLTLGEAVAELRRLAAIPWDSEPNVAPCMSWRTCGRSYQIIQFMAGVEPRKELRRIPALKISAAGVEWLLDREHAN